MNQYKLTFVKLTRNKRIVEDFEYHIFKDINECLRWLRMDLSVSCMPFFDITRVNNKLIDVYYNDKNMGSEEYHVEITRVPMDKNRQIKRYIQKGFSKNDSMALVNISNAFKGA